MNSVCSVPKQVEGGKESEVSHELESQENGTKVVKENDHRGEGYFCSVCGFDFKFQFKFKVGMDILYVLNVTLVKLEEAPKYLKNKRKEINHEGQTDLELSYDVTDKLMTSIAFKLRKNSESKSSTCPGMTVLEISLAEQTGDEKVVISPD